MYIYRHAHQIVFEPTYVEDFYMIDFTTEQAFPLVQAIEKVTGRRVHLSTAHRWRLKGIHSVKLDTALVGGRRMTSPEAVVRFLEATTNAADGDQPRPHTNRQRETEIKRAKDFLDEAGI
jgi:Protein of unknown function (DUF1580)